VPGSEIMSSAVELCPVCSRKATTFFDYRDFQDHKLECLLNDYTPNYPKKPPEQKAETHKTEKEQKLLQPKPKFVSLADVEYLEKIADTHPEYMQIVYEDSFETRRRIFDKIASKLSTTSDFHYSFRTDPTDPVPVIQIITLNSPEFFKALQFIGPQTSVRIEQVCPIPFYYYVFGQVTF
jgi:hypothetical protein